MKIKDHRQMMRSLTDPLNIPKLKQQLADNPVLTKEEFEARLYEPIPSFVVPEFDELSPKEQQYYHQGPFSTDEVFLGSKGGVPQLVQPGPGRQGYQGAHDKGAGERLREEITEASNKKYADILKEKNIKGKYTDITDAKVKSKIRSLYHTREVNPYKKIGFPRSKELIESNFKNFNKFLKSGQTLDDFYDLFKNPTFKLNLRAYLKGEAGTGITGAFDDLNFKTKYKKIIPKITEYLEVWHDYEQNPNKKFKTQRKKELVKKWSDLHTENMISKAKRVKKDDYANQLDLAHRQDLIIDQNISELGIERPEINRVLIKDAELERNKLHRKNFALVDEIKKGNNVEKNLRLIKENNARITKIAEITKGRLTGITINPDTLEAVKLKPSNVVAADAGILNKSIKNLSPDDKKILRTQILPQMIEEARAMTPEKIASELSGIMDDPVLSKKLAARMKNLKAGKQITKPVFEKSHEVYNIGKEYAQKTVPKGTKISVPAGSSRVASVAGVLDDALKTKTAKKVGRLLTKAGAPFEAGFIVTDYYNNLSRGMSKEEAWQTALSNATFGIYEGGSRAREKGLIDLAEAQGYSDWQVDGLKTMMNYKKLEDELRSEKFKLQQLIAEQESGVSSITGEELVGAIGQQKDLISQMETGLRDLGEKYWATMPEGEDFNTGKMFDDLLGYKARQEYNENVEARKHRVNPDMGEIGSPLWEALSDWKTYLPQNLMETTQATQPVVRNLRKLPGILGAMWDPTSEQAILSAMTPEEREERAAKLNIKRQTYDPMHETSTMTYDQMDPYYSDFEYMYKAKGGRVSYLDGGIVSLLKK